MYEASWFFPTTVTYGDDKLPLLLFRPEMGTRILGPCQSLGALFKHALHAILRKTKGFRSFAPVASQNIDRLHLYTCMPTVRIRAQ